MPAWQGIWQLRLWGRPLMVTRHSKQMLMPHRGPRGSPVTDLRKLLTPARATAADTIAPAGTVTVAPFTERVTVSAMRVLLLPAAGEIGGVRNRRGAVEY